jgi:hypothetical protein
MTSIFDQLEEQLREIASRDLRVRARPRSNTSRSWRLAVVVAAAASLAGTALAATGLWRPLLGEPGLGPPAAITGDPPPPSQLALLAVLRRAQTADDRSAATRAELRFINDMADGVRTDYIRLLSSHAGFGAAILVPVARITQTQLSAPPAVLARLPRSDALCMLIGDRAGEGSAKRCFTTADLLSGSATLSLGGFLFGLAPDGVRVVTVTFDNGSARRVVPSSNFFAIMMPSGGTPATMTWTMTNGPPRRHPI